jgi:hypothetical protein
MALRTNRRPAGHNLRVGKTARGRRSFFSVLATGETFADEKSVGSDAQRGMVMKAAPVASFEVVQAELLFGFLVVTLNAPANLDGGDQLLAGDVCR